MELATAELFEQCWLEIRLQPVKQKIVELSTDYVSVTVRQEKGNGITVTQTGSRRDGV